MTEFQLEEVKKIRAVFGGDLRKLEFLGFGRCTSHCMVEVVKGPAGAVVIFTEDPGNEGTSVINAAEDLITIVVIAQHLNPWKVMVIERDPAFENFSRLEFTWSNQEAGQVKFRPITKAEIGVAAALARGAA